MEKVFSTLAGLIFISLILYFGLSFFSFSIGSPMDWFVGVSTLSWLIIVVTVPWDAHFRAREVLNDAKISKRKDILVIEESLQYVERVAKRSLIIAIILHIVSAVGLYLVAALEISSVGYVGAVAAILLTFLRPAVNYYEYLQGHLANIRQEFRYPREDVQELLAKVTAMEDKMNELDHLLSLDNEHKNVSWRQEVEKAHQKFVENIEDLKKKMKENEVKAESQVRKVDEKLEGKIEKVKQDSLVSVEKLTTDSKILDSVREIASFIKQIKS